MDFAEASAKAGKQRAVARVDADQIGGIANRTAKPGSGDWVGIGQGRLASLKRANNTTREAFRQAVITMFGGESHIPDSVKDAMKMQDYGKGKPLTARRILAVKAAVDSVVQKTNTYITEGVAWMREKHSGICKICDVDKLVETAFSSCAGNTDAMDIVKGSLKAFIESSGGEIRSAEYIRNRADGLVANLNQFKALSAKIPGIYEIGREMLQKTGKPLPQDLSSALVKAACEVPIDSLKKLSGASSGLEIHKAVMDAFRAVEDIMNSTGADRKVQGGEEREPVRQFVLDVILSRCGKVTLENIKSALTDDATAHLLSYYDDCCKSQRHELFPNESETVRDGVADMGELGKSFLSKIASSVSVFLERLSPGAQPFQLPDYDFKPDIDGLGGDELLDATVSMANELNSQALEKHIDKTVEGSGKGAEAMKNIIRQKLDGVHEPDRTFKKRLDANAKAMMNWSICAEMKKIAADGGESSQFKKDIDRGTNATLTDGKTTIKLTGNFETARDELAQFVTGDANATYGNLKNDADRNKVHLLMAMISQETEKAGENGSSYAMDKREAEGSFTVTGFKEKEKQALRTYTVEKLKDGGISLHYTMDKPIKEVDDGTTGGDGYKVGDGSKFTCEIKYTLIGDEFNRVANLDYGKFDDQEGYKVFNRRVDMPDGTRQFRENKLEKVVDTFAQEFKVNVATCSMIFSMKLLPSDEDLIDAQH